MRDVELRLLSRRALLALGAGGAWLALSRSVRAQSEIRSTQTNEAYADADAGALTAFRAELDPYGTWIEDPVYGLVWVPNPASAGEDFAPYLTSGHWALSADGDWIWVSDYSWGWVVFHYGRWVWIAGVGWAWIPGRRYAHAWVIWRMGDDGWDYIGWAPMPPTFVWFAGVAVVFHFGAPIPFVFCRTRHVFDHHVRPHLVPPAQLASVARHTRRWHVPPASSRVGPPLGTAHVPASVVPSRRVAADPRARAASRPAFRRAAPSGPSAPAPPAAPPPRRVPERPAARPQRVTPPPPHFSIPRQPMPAKPRPPARRLVPPCPVRRAAPPPPPRPRRR